jgi:N,N'-diacetylchitobiose transport system substrate-binding protein
MGNTEMTKYTAAGAFQDLTANSFPNKSTWLQGLAASGATAGRSTASRTTRARVSSRTAPTSSGRSSGKVPQSQNEFIALAKKIGAKNKAKTFSPVYIAGTDWYVAMSFVYDYGGTIAITRKGKWVGTLDKPKALAGLAAYKRFFEAASRAPAGSNEGTPPPYDVMAHGNAASTYGAGWFTCCVGDYKIRVAQFVMPSHTKGQPIPGFLGGSDLAVPVGGEQGQGRGVDQRLHRQRVDDRAPREGEHPEHDEPARHERQRACRTQELVRPQSKNWVNVENGNVLRTMLQRILSGRSSIKDAASVASDNITYTLNQ